MAHDSQIVRAKENLKLSHSVPATANHAVEALRQSCQWVGGLTHRPAIKEETIAINHD